MTADDVLCAVCEVNPVIHMIEGTLVLVRTSMHELWRTVSDVRWTMSDACTMRDMYYCCTTDVRGMYVWYICTMSEV